MSIDARVRYTKMIIRNTFFSLLEEKSVSAITVKELCEKADINRATFYRYYQDIYDLLDQVEDENVSMLMEKTRESGTEMSGFIKSILDAIIENKNLYYKYMKSDAGEHFTKKILNSYYPEAYKSLSALYPNLSDERIKWYYSYITGGSASIIDSWVRNGMAEATDEVAGFIAKIFDATTIGMKSMTGAM